jgi:hypothetical protein
VKLGHYWKLCVLDLALIRNWISSLVACAVSENGFRKTTTCRKLQVDLHVVSVCRRRSSYLRFVNVSAELSLVLPFSPFATRTVPSDSSTAACDERAFDRGLVVRVNCPFR